ncbi:cytochrome aa3 quinol oxidase subunit II [Paenibacillus pini]|uniref:Quinol oxidase subunit 2 n=1 Tax=Paenibacillus pini JCM 16418 TaxID=1236976 RepID=W7YVC1_9BACL|nr:cytochrome aa3 quinol oxidase subunit II [Paenibacillus pini]GAF08556.1 AA3-600 quinol oxidase [Paenibacillus pini JCM 16418]
MKKTRWLFYTVIVSIVMLLSGCDSSLVVLNPKGPAAKTQSDTIIFSILMMAFVLIVVYILYVFMLVKYRASKTSDDYEPPHMEGSKLLEFIWTLIPIIIVVILSVVTVKSTNAVENVPAGYENEKPLVIYASSSNWKWHFSYPEENIETVNYVNIPENRPVEFRLYSYGPITSFWVPQLGGQKYAMSDMVTTLHLLASNEGSFMGKNSNFSGKGFAQMEFEVLSMTPTAYTDWVKEVKDTAPKLTESEFNSLVKTSFVGRKSFTSTHLEFSPPPMTSEEMGDMNGKTDENTNKTDSTDMKDMENMKHDN